MNESSVSSPWMKGMRLALHEAKVIKHRDASFIGLPDCSISYRKQTVWFEFKLWIPPKTWDQVAIPVMDVASASRAQFQMMLDLGREASASYYIMWAKKSKHIALWNPRTCFYHQCTTTADMIKFVANILNNYHIEYP